MFAAANANERAGHERILWVDDDQATLTIGKMILETIGYQVCTATSGCLGLELLGSVFDLVILDYDMPEKNGEALAHQIRAQLAPFAQRTPGALRALRSHPGRMRASRKGCLTGQLMFRCVTDKVWS